jgi:hypothetical protein
LYCSLQYVDLSLVGNKCTHCTWDCSMYWQCHETEPPHTVFQFYSNSVHNQCCYRQVGILPLDHNQFYHLRNSMSPLISFMSSDICTSFTVTKASVREYKLYYSMAGLLHNNQGYWVQYWLYSMCNIHSCA